MNLKEEIENIEIYSEKVKRLLNLIDEYIGMYDKFNKKFGTIVTELKEDFKSFFESEGFKVESSSKSWKFYEIYNELVAEYKCLEFKFVTSRERYGTTNMYFQKSKPETESLFIDIEPNINEYRIDINFKNIKKISGINEIEEIQKHIKSSRYSIEELDLIYNAIEYEKVNFLSEEIKKLENYYFIGTEKDKGDNIKKIEFKTIKELIEQI